MKQLLFVAALAACSGESVVVTAGALACEPRVVLANPGPSSGCFRAVAGDRSSVRLAGDDGPGDATVDVNCGDSYEVVTCASDWEPPKLEACRGAE
jgi:hypothetical protein